MKLPGKSGGERRRTGRRVRDRARQGLAILPSLLTLGNLVCGFYAIVHVGAVQWVGVPGLTAKSPEPAAAFQYAAIAILLAMIFDMLDGRVARMTRTTSDFGGQLDSLADAVTFGVAPGVMVAMLHGMGRYGGLNPFWSKMAWVFGAVYACAAVVRLARFNTETDSHDEESHLYFKGLPSPAGAGVIATLVLLHSFCIGPRAGTRLPWISPTAFEAAGNRLLDALPFVALLTGYLMVSRFRYVHVANYFLRGRKPVDYLAGTIFLGALFALFPEPFLAAAFCGFACTGPLGALLRRNRAAPAAVPAPAEGERTPSGRLRDAAPSQHHPLTPLEPRWSAPPGEPTSEADPEGGRRAS